MTFAAAASVTPDPWRWQPHPEVWLLVLGAAGLYAYAIRRIGPRANRRGEAVVTRGQLAWFGLALVVLLVASDWPIHDLAEEYLYSVHMVQHLLLSFVLAPVMLLATPTWLARLMVGQGTAYRVLRRLARPVPATILFNGVVVLTHWPAVVDSSVTSAPLHYGVHVLVVASALVMWMPVCGPLAELRVSLPLQMVHLFLQSIIPTVPAGWLTLAEGTVYRAYDRPYRLWGWSVATDQQTAGLLMKIGGGLFLWTVITVLFFKFVARHADDDRYRGIDLDRRAPGYRPSAPAPAAAAIPVSVVDDEPVLTWEDVARELERAGPPPPDPH